jgi:hypothetical protein
MFPAHLLILMALSVTFACRGEAQVVSNVRQDRPRLADYEFGFRLNQQEVIAYEGLWVRELIRNTTGRSLPQPDFLLGGTIFDIWLCDSTGKVVPVPIPRGTGFSFTSLASIEPGDSLVIYHYFANSLWDPSCAEKCLLPAGSYKIMIAIRRTRFSDHEGSSADSIVVLPFSIREATGLEAEAQVKYLHAHELFKSRSYTESVAAFRQIVTDFPTSHLLETVYRTMYFIESRVHSRGKDMEDWVSLGIEIVERIPQSPLCRKVGNQLKERLEPAVFDSLLSAVRARSPNSPILEIDMDEP